MNHKEKLAMVRKAFESRESDYSRTEVNVLFEEISLLEAEIGRLKAYTDPRLFAAASEVVAARFRGAWRLEGPMQKLEDAVAWWDSLPFDPDKDAEKLPRYKE